MQTELRDAYLAEWTAVAPMPQLLQIWAVAEIGAALHHAISYWQIQTHIEPHAQEDMRQMLPFWLRKVLALSKNLEERDGR
ncbi:MAG: hypothetical protein HC804_00075 [Anaerolineae bacterium]|nr:hypothetical protein [Anaerolineae bacterium]